MTTMIAESVSAQTSDPLHFDIGAGTVQRDIRDYPSAAPNSGYSWSIGVERQAYAHSGLSVIASRSHFANFLPTPEPQAAARTSDRRPALDGDATRAASKSSDVWDPANAKDGANDLNAYQLMGDFHQFLIPQFGRVGPYVGFGAGFTALSTADMLDIRPSFDAAAGFTAHATRHVGIYAEARYDWLGLRVGGDVPKSPKWLATPIRAGIIIQ